MRILVKLAFICVLAIAGASSLAGQASAGFIGSVLAGPGSAAHVSSFRHPVYYPGACRWRRDCYPRYHDHYYHGDIYAYRRKGYSCRYWYHRCRDNWFYGEDVRGCLRYYGCPTYY